MKENKQTDLQITLRNSISFFMQSLTMLASIQGC